jgi:RNA polymerase sigma factor (sigma-70 family)
LPTNDDLQKAFPLLSCLQPDRAVAVCVLIDAYDRLEVVGRRQDRRPDAERRYKPIIPEENLPQYCIYQASEKWEKDQESDFPSMEPGYRPTADDRLIRYIKTLALESMDRYSRYAAVGVGCYLYTYRPKQISALAEDLFSSENIRRVKKGMFKRLERRFPGICNDGEQVLLETPGERQRVLVNKSLAVLAPWYSCHTACATGSEITFLETYFDKESRRPELERIHMLFDTACCGLARLVREYNSFFPEGSKMRLDDPENKLRVPKFSDGHGGGTGGEGEGGPPDPGERFNPSPLTPAELSSVRHILNRNQRRRRLYQPGELRVYVDGVATATLTRESASSWLTVPDAASCIEVFGEDEYGELLLAVFPLSCLELDGTTLARELYGTHGGEPTFEISILPVPTQSGDLPGLLLRLEYGELREDAGLGAASAPHKASGVADPFIDEDSPGAEESPPGRARPGKITFPPPSRTPAHEVFWITETGEMTQLAAAYWSEAYENHFERLCAYARRRLTCGNREEAEDVVSEAFLRVVSYTKSPDTITNVFAYLWVTVRRVFDWKRRAEKDRKIESLDDVPATERDIRVAPEILRILEMADLVAEIRAISGSLNSRLKVLLELHLEGYSSGEIAARLGEDERLTRSDLNAVRAKVRYRLAKKKT